MPAHMLDLIEDGLEQAGRSLEGSTVALLGVAYLENADDTRNTPAADLAALLLHRGAEVVAHDPHVRDADWQRALVDGHEVPLTKDLDVALEGADCAAIVTRHRQYQDLTEEDLLPTMRTPVVVDGRNTLPRLKVGSPELLFRAIGKGDGAL